MGTLGVVVMLLATGVADEPVIWHGNLGELGQKYLNVSVDPLLAQLPIFVPESRLGDPELIHAIETLTFSELRSRTLVPTEHGERYWSFAKKYLEIGKKAALGTWEYSRKNVDWTQPRPTQFLPSKLPKLSWDWSELVDGKDGMSQTPPRYDLNHYNPWLALFARSLSSEDAEAFASGEYLTLVIPDDTRGRLDIEDIRPLLHFDPDPIRSVAVWLKLDRTSGKTHVSFEMWTVDGKKSSGSVSSSIYSVDWNYQSSAFEKDDIENLVKNSNGRRPRNVEEILKNRADQYSGRIVGIGISGEELRSVPGLVFEDGEWLVVRQSRAWQLPELIKVQEKIDRLSVQVAVDTESVIELAREWNNVTVWYQSITNSPRTTASMNMRLGWDRNEVLHIIDQLSVSENRNIWADGITVLNGSDLAKALKLLPQRSRKTGREIPIQIRLKRTEMFSPKSPGLSRGYLYPFSKRDPLLNWPEPDARWQLDVITRVEVIGLFADGEKSLDFMTVYQTIGYGDAPTIIKLAQKYVTDSEN